MQITAFGTKMTLSIEQLNLELLKLSQSIRLKPTDIVRLAELVNLGANVNCTNTLGNTPLHLAVQSGNFESVSKLLELGADPNKFNNDGNTPIHIIGPAFKYKGEHCKCLEALLEHGGSPLLKNNKGMTPLDLLKDAMGKGKVNKSKSEIDKSKSIEKLLVDGTTKWLESHKGDDSGYYIDSFKFNWLWNPINKLAVSIDSNKELMQDLEKAIKLNDVKAVVSLEKSGLDLTDPGLLKQVFIMHKYAIMNHLLDAGANPNITIEHKEKGEVSLLYYAILEGDQRAFDMLIINSKTDVNMAQPGQDNQTAIQCMHQDGVNMLDKNYFVRAIALHKDAKLDIPNKAELLHLIIAADLSNAKLYLINQQSGGIDPFYATLNVLEKLDKEELAKLSSEITKNITPSLSSTHSRLLKDNVVQKVWTEVKNLDWPKDADIRPIYDDLKKASKSSIISYNSLKDSIKGLSRCKQVEEICKEMKSAIDLRLEKLASEDTNQHADLLVQSSDNIEHGNLVDDNPKSDTE